MAAVELVATVREGTGKGVARSLRRQGWIPGILYGPGGENVPVTVEMNSLENMLRRISSGNVVLDVKLAGRSGEIMALIKEVQRDPVSDDIVHFDLEHITMSQKVRVQVPVHLEGASAGVKAGGILEHLQRDLDVECLASDIPEEIRIDISALERGDSIHVRDLDLPNVYIHNAGDQVIVSVVAKAKEEAPVAGVAAVGGVVADEGGAPAPEAGSGSPEAGS